MRPVVRAECYGVRARVVGGTIGQRGSLCISVPVSEMKHFYRSRTEGPGVRPTRAFVRCSFQHIREEPDMHISLVSSF
jgi:hypothetical protein